MRFASAAVRVGGEDREVLALNQKAMERMKAEVRLEIVPGASRTGSRRT